MGLEKGQTLDSTIPNWLENSERHPSNNKLLLVGLLGNHEFALTSILVFRGTVNENGLIGVSRKTKEGHSDYVFTFPVERIAVLPRLPPDLLPVQ